MGSLSLQLVLLCTLLGCTLQDHVETDHSKVHCGVPVNITHGHYEYLTHHDEDTYLTVIRYVCDAPIYHLEHPEDATFVCTDDNQWTNAKLKHKLPECHKVACGKPPAVDHGHFEYITTFGVDNYLSAVKYTCDDNYHERDFSDEGVYVCTIDGKWRNTDLGYEFPTCEKVVCGRPIVPLEQHQRVVGGHLVHNGATPWTVLMLGPSGTVVDGTLIDHHWVLTSAHALHFLNLSREELKEKLRVYVGIEDAREITAAHQVHVEDVHYHPRMRDAYVYRNDIALVKLKEDVHFSNHIMPACLPAHDYAEEGKTGHVAGWGVEGTGETSRANHLHWVSLAVANTTLCQAFFNEHHPGLFPADAPDQFCTQSLSDGHNVCPGDHGAALLVRDGDDYYAAGVLSYDEGCAGEVYAVYTDVHHYLKWIDGIIHPQ
uniref:Haptoglobin n=1 Tax=Ginglymostoma cirratum TaxID=7801 RepID=H9LEQ0_GINCI|nr:haptoglobin [Ginglymostoma cirratum]